MQSCPPSHSSLCITYPWINRVLPLNSSGGRQSPSTLKHLHSCTLHVTSKQLSKDHLSNIIRPFIYPHKINKPMLTVKWHKNMLKWPLEKITQQLPSLQHRVETTIMACSGEDIHKDFMVFKIPAKMWLETNGVPYHKQYMFILILLGKEGLHC